MLPADRYRHGKNLITDFDTSGVTRDYEVSVTGTDKVKIRAVPFRENWYGLTINGQSISSGDPIEIPLTGDSTEIAFEMKRMEPMRIRTVRKKPIPLQEATKSPFRNSSAIL